ncbi:alpha-mannosidase [Paenibacillus xylanexedens]|uniref:alpha-mannosidase n=1 Tax=Paenibacillus xylanexedens TaxID=528191 RepID=UPI0011A1AA85|nr:alpha-mannosidase [Paenibacillus xylanexedens]
MKMNSLYTRIHTIVKHLERARLTSKTDIPELYHKESGYHSWELVHEDPTSWNVFRKGDGWGGKDVHSCFKTRIRIPDHMEGKRVVCAIVTGADDVWNYDNPQFFAFLNGELICGLDVNHTEIDLTPAAVKGEEFELALYAYCSTSAADVFLNVYIAEQHQPVSDLYYDLRAALEAADLLRDDDLERLKLIEHLNQAVNLLDLRQENSADFHASVLEARQYLQNHVYSDARPAGDHIPTVHCIGHTHIDVAWLWTLDQTREKVIRSFASVLYLMDKFPEYTFMSSQPQLYSYLKSDYPALYAKIKEKVAEGRWEAEGSMWLEADCNLISGESMIRQIIYGKRFFKEEFGVENRVLWLPDVFGYSAAMPQIMRKSGIDYFMTTKIAWNDTNQIPNDTMYWRGIDGSEVLTHFITATDYDKHPEFRQCRFETTYNGRFNASQIKGTWQRYQNKNINTDVLQCYGFGDGGGGPTEEMLEQGRRLEKRLPGMPTVKRTFVREFFEKLEQNLADVRSVPRWSGELYLEYHRGTYTSMARNKRYNRHSEFALADAELFSVIRQQVDAQATYPTDALEHAWKLTMLNQFHDTLPGSSIEQVYIDSKEQYEEVFQVTDELKNSALNGIVSSIQSDGETIVVFNTTGFERTDMVELPAFTKQVTVYDGERPVPSQRTTEGGLVFLAENVPPSGYKSFRILPDVSTEQIVGVSVAQWEADQQRIQTPWYDVQLNESAEFVSVWDKLEGRELLQSGKRGNVLQVFEDRPAEYEAWNIDEYYEEHMWEVSDLQALEWVESGPVRSVLQVKRQFLDSVVEQRIIFYAHTRRIDFRTLVDWKQEHLLLKTAFPLDIWSEKAVYEIQYGNVERATHRNTSWDQARFEVCGQKWADLAENGYGVALLNDCKYGHDIHNSVMRLSLIKSATYPNENADKELHEFTYSLYPHKGDFREGRVIQAAYDVNRPLVAREIGSQAGSMPEAWSLASVDQDNVVLEVIKKAEDNDDIIIRVYEAHGRRTRAALQLPEGSSSTAYACDLLENVEAECAVDNGRISFDIKPYEILTFRIPKA